MPSVDNNASRNQNISSENAQNHCGMTNARNNSDHAVQTHKEGLGQQAKEQRRRKRPMCANDFFCHFGLESNQSV